MPLQNSVGWCSYSQNLAKDNMLAIKVGSGDSGDKELAAIAVGPSIGHGQQSRLLMRELKGFILKLSSVDGLPSPVCLAAEHGSNITMLMLAAKVSVSQSHVTNQDPGDLCCL